MQQIFPQDTHSHPQKALWEKPGNLALQLSSAQGPKAAGL